MTEHVNGDGIPDFVSAHSECLRVSIWYSVGDEYFYATEFMELPGVPTVLSVDGTGMYPRCLTGN